MSDPRRDDDEPTVVARNARIESRVSKLPQPPKEKTQDPYFSFVQTHMLHAERGRAELREDIREMAEREAVLRKELAEDKAVEQVYTAQIVESVARVASSVDTLSGRVMALDARFEAFDGRLGRLEARTESIANAQGVHGDWLNAVRKEIKSVQVASENSFEHMNGRISRNEKRLDDIERRFQQFVSLVDADIKVRRKLLEKQESEDPPVTVRPPKKE